MSDIIYFPIPIKKFRGKNLLKRHKKNDNKFRNDLFLFLLYITLGLILGYLSSFFYSNFQSEYEIQVFPNWRSALENYKIVIDDIWHEIGKSFNLLNIWLCIYSCTSFALIFVVWLKETINPISNAAIRISTIYSLYFIFFAKGMQIYDNVFDPGIFLIFNLVATIFIITIILRYFNIIEI